MKKTSFSVAIIALFATASAVAQEAREFQTAKVKQRAETLATGLSNPWGLDFLPDGAIWLLADESGGAIIRVSRAS